MIVLGIESSCDETAASVVDGNRVLSDVVSSQVDVHKIYGGVVPELASRNHIVSVAPVIETALKEANTSLSDLDGIVATSGPGLLGSLVIGLQAAKTLSYATQLPFVGVNHLRGHLLAARIQDETDTPIPEFPYMALLASGGHTGVYHVRDWNDIECLGETRDDAAGEAFDKVAKLLGLGYPGGPVIDRMAATEGDEISFPQALRQKKSYEFSFSGVKTAVAQHVHAIDGAPGESEMFAIVRGFQKSVVEILVRKVVLAARQKQVSRVVLAGGVAANSGLRAHAAEICTQNDLTLFAPPRKRCTDNASMIAYAGLLSLQAGERSGFDISPKANWPL
ncbi:MAG: tRNA (adenosine(37)-N6)-threonylcarbamoyltransferase complex transferase subunit TsaD [Deltaproteobacteria bacterium]|nr:tRNA (adenosine(37)-N6)-threonylcarbamoyltransferase complex transferase subunit TsaD [Deltaproteobacteria bacterium]MBN2672690.1 tRNA (adenosine(37)-N6)-threonylcarbamoyltransferase complex transferase subunit TsaD [Deltaproteobacteria bacterium]